MSKNIFSEVYEVLKEATELDKKNEVSDRVKEIIRYADKNLKPSKDLPIGRSGMTEVASFKEKRPPLDKRDGSYIIFEIKAYVNISSNLKDITISVRSSSTYDTGIRKEWSNLFESKNYGKSWRNNGRPMPK
uniref:Uncharacterized protein n=1 Tax=Ochrobactrum phage ORM_20 TaxID=2985243 RepID=A0A9N6WWJ2_9VIRU|nr:hypothetical protein ORM20_00017 [Ochrobactrum phage ORM_20]